MQARYPIREYVDNWVRSGASAVEELSTERDLGCSVFIQNGNARLSGACAAVQCSLGGGAWAGPGMTGSSPPTRETGVTNTGTASWTNFTLVEISDDAEQLKNVFLYRTGDYVATTRRTYQWNTNPTLRIGKLPTSNGNNYGSWALLMIRSVGFRVWDLGFRVGDLYKAYLCNLGTFRSNQKIAHEGEVCD